MLAGIGMACRIWQPDNLPNPRLLHANANQWNLSIDLSEQNFEGICTSGRQSWKIVCVSRSCNVVGRTTVEHSEFSHFYSTATWVKSTGQSCIQYCQYSVWKS